VRENCGRKNIFTSVDLWIVVGRVGESIMSFRDYCGIKGLIDVKFIELFTQADSFMYLNHKLKACGIPGHLQNVC
jgi:hypothetical protein